jgi:hypothetical protein
MIEGRAPEDRFGTKDCRKLKCPDLIKEDDEPGAQSRCRILKSIPGNLPCCAREIEPELFIRIGRGSIIGTYIGETRRPGMKNCPDVCPYKDKPAKKCRFTGREIKDWLSCPCSIIDNKDQANLLLVIRSAIQRREKERPSTKSCIGFPCPDGIFRCTEGMTGCPILLTPFTDMERCPIWTGPIDMPYDDLPDEPPAEIPRVPVAVPVEVHVKETPPAPVTGKKEYPLEVWRAEAERRFGKDPLFWKFKCPTCGHVQCGDDFVKINARATKPLGDRSVPMPVKDPKNVAFQECIGRYDGNAGGCSYVAFGLIHSDITVKTSGGVIVYVFPFAEVP